MVLKLPIQMGRLSASLVCLLIVALDIAAGILGIEAEVAQSKGKHLRAFFFECKEPVHQAYRLGLAAAILLALAHVIANFLGGCLCICSKEELAQSSSNKQFAAGILILTWIIFGIGFTMLMVGAMSNSKSRVSCGITHRKFLSIGGILCFVHGIISVACYVSTTAVWVEEGKVRRDVGV